MYHCRLPLFFSLAILVFSSTVLHAQTIVKVNDYRPTLDEIETETSEQSEQKTFDVIIEANLPKGFPGPGPVGKVIEKEYPVSRIAEAKSDRGNPFFRLFRHIQKNEIAMTTPVKMEVTRDEEREQYNMQSMGFYYESDTQGVAGPDDTVSVNDYPKMRVLSIGMTGRLSNQQLDQSKEQIETYLKENNLQKIGKFRIMGYNSPSVPNSRKYSELQIEVQPMKMEAVFDENEETEDGVNKDQIAD